MSPKYMLQFPTSPTTMAPLLSGVSAATVDGSKIAGAPLTVRCLGQTPRTYGTDVWADAVRPPMTSRLALTSTLTPHGPLY